MPTPYSRLLRVALAASAWLSLVSPAAAAAQTVAEPPLVASAEPGGQTHDLTGQDAAPPAVAQYPSLHLVGFGDIDFASQDKSEGPRGFTEGQFVLHFASALSPHVSVFSELSFTPRADAGTGTPPATGFNAEVERLIIRFDRSDRLKLSFGRYHTPINWWNTAYHHGLWLQTTIARPEMVQFGGQFIPVHFVGALAEGSFPAGGWNLNYQGGVGNGRGNVISRAGDAGDNNAQPAWLLNVFTKPDVPFGLQVGGSVYFDRISQTARPEYNEQIFSAHAVWLHEDPEVIAEIADVRHTPLAGGLTVSNVAYYAQGAYRFHGAAHLFKPYYRFEHNGVDPADPVFTAVPNLDVSTYGVRYDISTYAAIKVEGRTRKQSAAAPWTNGGFFQIAFTF